EDLPAPYSTDEHTDASAPIELRDLGYGDRRNVDRQRTLALEIGIRTSPHVTKQHEALALRSDDHVLVSIPVYIEEDGHASPANVDSEVLIRNKLERRFRRRAHVLVEVDRPRCLSDEQVEIAIVVDVDESRSGVAPASELHEAFRHQVQPRAGIGPCVAVPCNTIIPCAEHHVDQAGSLHVPESRCVMVGWN